MELKERLILLFDYLKQYENVSKKIPVNISEELDHIYLKNIPVDKNIDLFYGSYVTEENSDQSSEEEIILTVKKCDFEPHPKLPESLTAWIEDGWDDWTKEPIIIPNKILVESYTDFDGNIVPPTLEYFDDIAKRSDSYKKWIKEREKWVLNQKKIKKIRDFFVKLYNIYTDLNRESGQYEFVIADGIFEDIENNRSNDESLGENKIIRYPILSKRLKLILDPQKNIIKIINTEKTSELYLDVLSRIEGISLNNLKAEQDELANNDYHPLDRTETPDFLRRLLHQLSPDSQFIENPDIQKAEQGDKYTLTLNPVFILRKKTDGSVKIFENIIEEIKNENIVPNVFKTIISNDDQYNIRQHSLSEDITTLEDRLALASGESKDILMYNNANKEQLEIAKRVEKEDVVVIQGPPGTGKTHTIANLIGHFLAQGKRILVTSYKEQALSVLKEKLPEEIQNLCVSDIENNFKELENSVNSITEMDTKTTPEKLKEEILKISSRRNKIMEELDKIRLQIFQIKNKEFNPIDINGNKYLPLEMSKFIHNNYEKLAHLIPGDIDVYSEFPLSENELTKLYHTNTSINPNEEKDLDINLPEPDSLMEPQLFKNKLEEKNYFLNHLNKLINKFQCKFEIDENDNIYYEKDGIKNILGRLRDNNYDQLGQYFKSIKSFEKWKLEAILAGEDRDGKSKLWSEMIELIIAANEKQDEMITHGFDKTIEIANIIEEMDVFNIINKIEDKIRKSGRLSGLSFLFDKQSKIFLDNVTINRKPITSVEDCVLIRKTLELSYVKKRLEIFWNKLMAKNGMYKFKELDSEYPEKIARNLIPDIEFALEWKKSTEKEFDSLIKSIGIDMNALFNYGEVFDLLDNDLRRLEKTLKFKFEILPAYVDIFNIFFRIRDIQKLFNRNIYILSKENRAKSKLCQAIVDNINDEDINNYKINYNNLLSTQSKTNEYILRNSLLEKIKKVAPTWAENIRKRIDIHGSNIPNNNLIQGWKWKQFDSIVSELLEDPYANLQKHYHQISKELKEATVQLIVTQTWYHMLMRLQNNNNLKKNLTGWLQLKRKIGKGTGKRASQLKNESKQYMKDSIAAVPAWIMTTNNTMESLDLKREMFDIVIIDEASQSSIRDLLFLYAGKKVIVVGDDKQVSPINIGANITQIENLIRSTIRGYIPNHSLYDGRYSLYDIAVSNFTSLMLIEHFRCVPDIIGYSNQLCYNDKIKPLRDGNNSQLYPNVINFRVDGIRERKINKKEAEKIILLIKACINQEEYNGKTFGIISLLGEEQVKYIQKLLNIYFETDLLEERKIKVGVPANFQGDERDVVFLTMVDTGEEDGPLSLKSDKEETLQRYNVAASRGRDQMWIVNSLDPNKDLKQNDMRKQLIEYANTIQNLDNTSNETVYNTLSEFEKTVSEKLSEKGFNIILKYEIGAYKIDMIIKSRDKKIAIECDGANSNNGEVQIINDMERQTILERIGWKFIRIRSSEFYRNPNKTIENIIDKLSEYDIYPETPSKNKLYNKNQLFEKVIQEAELLEKNFFFAPQKKDTEVITES
ncbi:AAA domain-containing protein [Fusobacterium sp. PH5-44]|uniref:AAA domain-containing protein n=1 Tax=unclassified Fusobacterium TaxID=2648384 RepID=UPI003D222644